VLDVIFVGLTILFFVLGIGYVAMCDSLMKR
jgi:succinate-acetate transporter protein